MKVFSDRPIVLFELPAAENSIALHPEQAVLKCSIAIDLGALCFLKRSDERRRALQGRKVALDSFDKARAKSIHSLVNKFLQESAARRLAVSSIEGRGTILIKFIDWCDLNENSLALESISHARPALKGFVAHLRQLSDVQRISVESAYTFQTNLIHTLQLHFGVSNISLGINLIVRDRGITSRTEVPTQDRLAKFLSLHEAVFEGIFDLVLAEKQFPFAVRMPKFAAYKNNMMWIFPSDSGWAKHPESRLPGKRRLSIDYANGQIMGVDQAQHLYSSAKSATAAIAKTLATLTKGNDDMRATARIRFACLANLAFVRIFEAITGANRADIGRIEWTAELAAQIAKPDAERQGFRSLKVRANNREVFYQIGVSYFPMLRKFIKLRAWLLDGASHQRMFFHYNAPEGNGVPGPTLIKRFHYTALEVSLLVIYPAYKQIRLCNRKTRAAKQDDTIRKHDPATGAKIMQHSLVTAVRYYSNGSVEVAREEMGNFLQKVHTTIVEGRHLPHIEEERATGRCISKNTPRSNTPNPPIQPDCIRSEGCLFCDKYRAHADDKDVRKLLSAKYVVEQTSSLAGSAEEYDRIFGAIILRIDRILLEIGISNTSMVGLIERITKEVARGEMDSYWSTKMEELLEAGIL